MLYVNFVRLTGSYTTFDLVSTAAVMNVLPASQRECLLSTVELVSERECANEPYQE